MPTCNIGDNPIRSVEELLEKLQNLPNIMSSYVISLERQMVMPTPYLDAPIMIKGIKIMKISLYSPITCSFVP